MSKPTLLQLLEAGVHFGHKTKKWNPKMKPFIFTKRSGVYVIDLAMTKKCLDNASQFLKDLASQGKSVIFVGTKKQAALIVKEEAQRAGVFYVNKRWIGGLLTNFEEVKETIERLSEIEKIENSDEFESLTTKERYDLKKEKEKLQELVGGLRGLGTLPAAIFVIDPVREKTAIFEVNKMSIPVVALVDTSGDPTSIDYPIPGNDDALRSIALITKVIADAILEGKKSRHADNN